jgi:holo-[acyl-carrier protein] synthase
MILGLGVDIVDIGRARRMYQDWGDRLLVRVCTPTEAAYVRSRADAAPHLAARLAAKEAAYKALAGSLSARAIGWKELEVISDGASPPALVLHGRARARAAELGAAEPLLTISHSDGAAVAVVLIQTTP